MSMYNTELFNFLFSDNKYLSYPSVEDKIFVTRENYFFEGKPTNSTLWNTDKVFISSKSKTLAGPLIQPKILSTIYSKKSGSTPYTYTTVSLTNNVEIQLQPINKTLYINGKNLIYRNRNNDSNNNELATYISYKPTENIYGPLIYSNLSITSFDNEILDEGELTINGTVSINSLNISQDIKLKTSVDKGNSKLWIKPINNGNPSSSTDKLLVMPAAATGDNIPENDTFIKLSKFDFILNGNNQAKFLSFIDTSSEHSQLLDSLGDAKPVQELYLYDLDFSGELFTDLNVSSNDIILGLAADNFIYKLSYENGAYVIHSKFTNELNLFPEDDAIPGNLITDGDTVEFHELDENADPNNCFKFRREGNVVHIYGNTLIEEDS